MTTLESVIFLVVAVLAIVGAVAGYVTAWRAGDRTPPLDGIAESGAVADAGGCGGGDCG